MSADAGLGRCAVFERAKRTITAQVLWILTTMPTTTATTGLGYSISQHLRAIKILLRDVVCGPEYVRNG